MNISNNILIVGAEIAIILLGLLIINWLVYIGLKLISKTPWLKEHIQSIHRFIRRCLIGLGVLICLSVIGVNGILIYQGKNISQVQLDLLRSIPPQFWVTLGIALLKSVSLLMIVKLSLPSLNRAIDKISNSLVKLEQISKYQEDIYSAFKRLKKTIDKIVFGWVLLSYPSAFFQGQTLLSSIFLLG